MFIRKAILDKDPLAVSRRIADLRKRLLVPQRQQRIHSKTRRLYITCGDRTAPASNCGSGANIMLFTLSSRLTSLFEGTVLSANQISFTNPTSTSCSIGMLNPTILLRAFSRIHKNTPSMILRAMFVPCAIRICSLPTM